MTKYLAALLVAFTLSTSPGCESLGYQSGQKAVVLQAYAADADAQADALEATNPGSVEAAEARARAIAAQKEADEAAAKAEATRKAIEEAAANGGGLAGAAFGMGGLGTMLGTALGGVLAGWWVKGKKVAFDAKKGVK